MSNVVYRYLSLTALALVLTGCLSTQQAPAPIEQSGKPSEPATPPVTVPAIPDIPSEIPPPTVDTTPKIRTYQWSATIPPLIDRMLKADGVTAGSVLLVDTVNNRTNGSLQTSTVTDALNAALANNRRFVLITPQQLALAKQQLGLSPQDSLGSRSKAIGIALQAGASYVLYSSVSGNVNTPTLKMQLMQVQTGEIIWSGQGAVQQNNDNASG